MACGQFTSPTGKSQIERVPVGTVFSRWTVIGIPYKKPSERKYVACRCQCGAEKDISVADLLYGQTHSCGCLQRERAAAYQYRHGDAYAKLYYVWKNIRERCSKPTSKAYKDYGGRGIRVCDEWQQDYATFREWAMANGYRQGLAIDRIDTNGNYCPENCRWVTSLVNNRNRRQHHYVTAFGETKLLVEWVEDPRCSVCYNTLHGRIIEWEWEPEKAISTPSRRR